MVNWDWKAQVWQRRRGYCPATAGTLGTAVVKLGNSGHDGGGAGLRARRGGG